MTEPLAPLAVAHVDDTGAPCAHHQAASRGSLLQLALVGTRATAFHHDCASKLQGILMALEELGELTAQADPEVVRAIDSAIEASRELNALLATSRQLTKPPVKAVIGLGELVARAAARVSVTVHGALPDASVEVAIPAISQALALAIDVAAGAGRTRSLAIAGALVDAGVELTLEAAAVAPTTAPEALAIASFAIERDGGRLWCAATGGRMFVRLPVG
jgi:hypothetical protein